MKRILIFVVMLLVGFWGLAEAEISPTPVSIKLLSPNGGEVVQLGTAQKVRWKSSTEIKSVVLSLIDQYGNVIFTNLENVSGNPGYTYWIIPWHNVILPGIYKISIIGCLEATACSHAKHVASDVSDAVFEIVSPLTRIMTVKASPSSPMVTINVLIQHIKYMSTIQPSLTEFRILIESGVYNKEKIHIETEELRGKTLKIYCPDGAILTSSHQQTIHIYAPGAKLIVEGCTIKNDYVPEINQHPLNRTSNAAIFAQLAEEVQLRRNIIMSANTNGVVMSYIGSEILTGNEIHSPRIGVLHANMGEKRINRNNIIIGSAIAHFFNYTTSVYPLPNDAYWYVALGGATTANSKIPPEVRIQFNGELW